MDNLEQFIRKHAILFDDQEPADGHFDRFGERLNRLHQAETRSYRPQKLWLKIAAGVVILATIGLVALELSRTNFSSGAYTENRYSALPEDVQEILQVFELRSTQQISELEQMAVNCSGNTGFIDRTKGELSRLDQRMNELMDVLVENPANSRIRTALVQQCKARETLLNDALLQGKLQKCTGEEARYPSR